MYVVGITSIQMEKPTQKHQQIAKHTLVCVKGTIDRFRVGL